MFWKRKETGEGEAKLPGPKEIPYPAGRNLVVEEKKDPDWVWKLKGVVRPAGKKKAFYCRIFSQSQVEEAGVQIKDWTSLDNHPELIIWEGFFDEEKNIVNREKYVKPEQAALS